MYRCPASLSSNGLGTFAGGTALTITVPLSPTGTYHIYSVGASSKAVAVSVVTLSGHGAGPRTVGQVSGRVAQRSGHEVAPRPAVGDAAWSFALHA